MFVRRRSAAADAFQTRSGWQGTRARPAHIATGMTVALAAVSAIVLPASAGNRAIISTVAGNGTSGYSGDGGPGTSAQLLYPASTAADRWGNTLIADSFNCRIRVVATSTGTFYGVAMTAGDIYTVAGNGLFGFGGDGGPATSANVAYPQDIKSDKDGNIIIADTFSGRVRVVAASTGTFYGVAMAAGDMYTVAGNGTFGTSGDGGPATQAELDRPWAVAFDRQGDIAVADVFSNSVRVVAAQTGIAYGVAMTAGDIYTVAGNGTSGYSGDGGAGTSAQLNFPDALAVDGPGNLVVADSSNNVIRVLASRSANFYGVDMQAGDIYTVAGTGSGGFSGDGGPARAARFNLTTGVTVDGAGDLIVADGLNNRLRAVAVANGSRYGVQMQAGDVYTVAGSSVSGFAGDGGPATSASLNFPAGVAVNGTGDILIADQSNNRVRMVTR